MEFVEAFWATTWGALAGALVGAVASALFALGFRKRDERQAYENRLDEVVARVVSLLGASVTPVYTLVCEEPVYPKTPGPSAVSAWPFSQTTHPRATPHPV